VDGESRARSCLLDDCDLRSERLFAVPCRSFRRRGACHRLAQRMVSDCLVRFESRRQPAGSASRVIRHPFRCPGRCGGARSHSCLLRPLR
jgi:hypothetical protein